MSLYYSDKLYFPYVQHLPYSIKEFHAGSASDLEGDRNSSLTNSTNNNIPSILASDLKHKDGSNSSLPHPLKNDTPAGSASDLEGDGNSSLTNSINNDISSILTSDLKHKDGSNSSLPHPLKNDTQTEFVSDLEGDGNSSITNLDSPAVM